MNTPNTIRIFFAQQNIELGVKQDDKTYRVRISALTLTDGPDKYAFNIVGPNPISDMNIMTLSNLTRILDGSVESFVRFTDGRALYLVGVASDNAGGLAPILQFTGQRITISAFDALYEFTIPQAIETEALMQLLSNGYMPFTKVI